MRPAWLPRRASPCQRRVSRRVVRLTRAVSSPPWRQRALDPPHAGAAMHALDHEVQDVGAALVSCRTNGATSSGAGAGLGAGAGRRCRRRPWSSQHHPLVVHEQVVAAPDRDVDVPGARQRQLEGGAVDAGRRPASEPGEVEPLLGRPLEAGDDLGTRSPAALRVGRARARLAARSTIRAASVGCQPSAACGRPPRGCGCRPGPCRRPGGGEPGPARRREPDHRAVGARTTRKKPTNSQGIHARRRAAIHGGAHRFGPRKTVSNRWRVAGARVSVRRR